MDKTAHPVSARRSQLSALALFAVSSSFSTILPAQATETHHHAVVAADSIRWGVAPPSLPAGAQAAVLLGHPSKTGPFVIRLKFPAAYVIPPHRHSKDEMVTVISGQFRIGTGEMLDRTSMQTLAPASFVHLPAGMAHYAVAADVETVVQINGVGPFDVTYVNPRDDPRKQ